MKPAAPWFDSVSVAYGTFRRAFISGLLLAGALCVGCGGDNSGGAGGRPIAVDAPESIGSARVRNLAPAVADSDQQARVDGNNVFAGDFYRAVAALPESAGANLVYSPYSLTSALAMTYAGAAGDTATQMATVLRISQPENVFHASSNWLDLELTSRDVNASDAALQVTNGVFLQRGFSVKPEFIDTLGVNYGAPVYLMDNLTMAAAETSRGQINAWVSSQTNNKIVDLLAPESTFLAKLVLTNAVLFKGNWALPFDAQLTQPAAFSLLSGTTVDVPMMRQDIRVQVASGGGFTAVSVPYVGGAFEMVLVLPDPGKLAAIEAVPLFTRPAELLGGAAQRYIWLSLPRFKFTTKLSANELLIKLGMNDAFFTALADFSAINGGRDLSIKQVVHSAAIALDEKGTEASAATAVVVGPGSLPTESIIFDRPFLFLITDKATQSVIFVGRVMDPTQS